MLRIANRGSTLPGSRQHGINERMGSVLAVLECMGFGKKIQLLWKTYQITFGMAGRSDGPRHAETTAYATECVSD
jgi:hypothetical protein